ncbi:alkane 1-monooxygenase [Solimonas marina]|uniref:Alkane 1-monooxygenase n=1 Tax=Solimonas marina TaxID=2714601 RepID=A0A969W715_9GAMM|nr:alkane 1-monooxygenase [Solimonas marina]NKF21074.1 alkane 1-monooxygenase [Solimonas marina]
MNTTVMAPAWRDNKRYLWPLGGLIMLLVPIAGVIYGATGWGWAWWLGPIVVYGLIPLADLLIGTDTNNPPEERVPSLEQERYYRWAVYFAVACEYVSVIWGAWMAADGHLPWYDVLGLALTIAMVTGVSINTGHELGHKTDKLEQWLAKIALAPTAYGHFFVEHNRGHHVRVATPEDPASSRFGESFWAFLPRTMIGSLKSSWEIEAARLRRNGKPVWSIHNNNLNAWAMTVVLFGGLALWLGWQVLPFLLLQAFVGASLLEVVNYLEHYGLCREKRADGKYERCQPRHSWNSNHIVTNVFLYQLQRHSDHHANPTRSYQSLRHFDEAPQLPTGYAGMILLAYMTPLWFKIMNPRVVAHYGGDMSRANIKPSIRKSVIERYAPQRRGEAAQ